MPPLFTCKNRAKSYDRLGRESHCHSCCCVSVRPRTRLYVACINSIEREANVGWIDTFIGSMPDSRNKHTHTHSFIHPSSIQYIRISGLHGFGRRASLSIPEAVIGKNVLEGRQYLLRACRDWACRLSMAHGRRTMI